MNLPPEVDGVVEADSPAALDPETRDQPGAAGQGLQMDSQVRKAIEDAAQDCLMNYYRKRGWTVTDTRQNRPYDAVVDKGPERIYLEAKGTQSRGDCVIVSRNEVNHARQHPGACVMGAWSGMRVVDGVVDRGAGDFRILPFSPPLAPTIRTYVPVISTGCFLETPSDHDQAALQHALARLPLASHRL